MSADPGFRPGRRLGAAIAVTISLMSLAGAPAGAGIPVQMLENGVPTLAPLMRQVTPAVVNIATRSKVRIDLNPLFRDPFFRRFFDIDRMPREREHRSAGSGVIVDAAKGYILSNYHVVDAADEITVTLKDRREFKARLVGSDKETDVALLQIKAEDLTAIPLGDSDTVQVGDFVVAIGNPFGLGQTVTSGIVSAVGRTGLGIEGYEDFIQTDASINPGNSGGALVNMRGELIGINTAIIGPTGGNVGIGFAVPINMAHSVMRQLLKNGSIRRGHLGVVIRDLTPDLAREMESPIRTGAVVVKVSPDSPADRAGLRSGDVVTQVNEDPVRTSADLRNRIGLLTAGQRIALQVVRGDRTLTLQATVE